MSSLIDRMHYACSHCKYPIFDVNLLKHIDVIEQGVVYVVDNPDYAPGAVEFTFPDYVVYGCGYCFEEISLGADPGFVLPFRDVKLVDPQVSY